MKIEGLTYHLSSEGYVPSDAPTEAHCGLYSDDQRQVFVSSGVGTRVIPFRFLAQSQWNLITLQ